MWPLGSPSPLSQKQQTNNSSPNEINHLANEPNANASPPTKHSVPKSISGSISPPAANSPPATLLNYLPQSNGSDSSLNDLPIHDGPPPLTSTPTPTTQPSPLSLKNAPHSTLDGNQHPPPASWPPLLSSQMPLATGSNRSSMESSSICTSHTTISTTTNSRTTRSHNKNHHSGSKGSLVSRGELHHRKSRIIIRKFQKLDQSLLNSTPAPDVKIGQRVAYKEYYGNEFGTIRWIGE